MKKTDTIYAACEFDYFKAMNTSLADKSDRVCTIVAASWVDHFLKVKFMNEFSEGNAEAREALFSGHGPFSALSAKLNVAFCAGWIDGDLYHDLKVIKKLRDGFAHTIDSASFDDEPTSAILAKFRVPSRHYDDWGKVRVAAIEGGVVIYKGEKPDNAGENLSLPGTLTFRLAIPVIVAVFVANLGIPFAMEEEGCIGMVKLPEHMEK